MRRVAAKKAAEGDEGVEVARRTISFARQRRNLEGAGNAIDANSHRPPRRDATGNRARRASSPSTISSLNRLAITRKAQTFSVVITFKRTRHSGGIIWRCSAGVG